MGCARNFATLMVSAILSGSVYGQTQPAPLDQREAFVHFLVSPSTQKFIENSLNGAENPALKAECSNLQLLEANRFDFVEQPVFERNEKGINIRSGSWVSVVKVDRCGQPATRRLYIKYLPDQNRFEVHPLAPGDFRGNLKLESDARKIVIPGLMGVAQCKESSQFFLLDVKAQGIPTNQGWSELWRARACDKTVSATVSYQATSGGMNIDAQNLKVE